MHQNIETTRPDPEWWARLEERGNLLSQPVTECCERCKPYLPLMQKLKSTLARAGYAAILPHLEEDIVKITSRGEFIQPIEYYLVKGAPIRCHANSAAIWEENQNNIVLMTGYALSEDGVWRQHTWCLMVRDPDTGELCPEAIVETTVPRVLYYGFRLTNEESDNFYEENMC